MPTQNAYDTLGQTVAGSDSSASDGGTVAFSFTSTDAAGAALSDVQLSLEDATPTDGGSVTVALYSNDASRSEPTPGTLIATLGTIQDSALSGSGSTVVDVPVSPGVSLSAGTRYWIEVTGSSGSGVTFDSEAAAAGAGAADEYYFEGGLTLSDKSGAYIARVVEGQGTVGGTGGNYYGGAGGTLANPNGGAGGDGGGGGGGGPGGSGGAGGAGGTGTGTGAGGSGGAGGANGSGGPGLPTVVSSGANGQVGGVGASYRGGNDGGGGGGGAGGYGAIASTSGTLRVNVTGGSGGTAGPGGGSANQGPGDGGGGGGGGGGLSFGGTSLSIAASVAAQGGGGGVGGAGGGADVGAGTGGTGGDGGDGLDLTGSAAIILTNAGMIIGGSAGSGGSGGYAGQAGIGGNGGSGGDGGDGLDVDGAVGTTLTNSGTISGGAAGAGGPGESGGHGSGASGQAGTDGAGIVGANLTITNTGTIAGGGSTGDAIHFTGGANLLRPDGGTLTGALDIDGAATTLAIDTGAGVDAQLGNAITGTGSLTAETDSTTTQLGALTLTGTETYSGSTTVQGSATAYELVELQGSILNSQAITIAANGLLYVEAANALTTTATVTLTGSGGGLFLEDSAQISGLNGATGTVTLADGTTLTIGTNNGADTFGGVIEDADGAVGSVTKIGTGTLTLTGVEAYTGKTSVSAGTLALAGSGSLHSSTKVALTASGATLDISGATTTEVVNKLGGVAGTFAKLGGQNLKIKVQSGTVDAFSGVIQDGGIAGGTGGSLTLGGPGELNLTAAETYTGATTLDAGTLALTGAGSIASSSGLSLQSSLGANATFDISGETAASIGPLSGVSGALVDLGAGTLTVFETAATAFAGVIADGGLSGGTGGNLVVEGAALTLTGVSTYTGKTSVSGTLDLSGSASIHSSTKVSLTTSGATLDISGATGGEVINKLGGVAGTVTDLGNQNLKIKVQSGTVDTYAGTIKDGGVNGGTGGSVTLGGLGELSLSAANSYTGGTEIDAGTLDLAAQGAAGSGTITFANPSSNGVATLEIDAAALSGSNGIYSFGNAIAGATSTNQVIDLTSLSYVQGATSATLVGTTLNVNDGSSDVTLQLAAAQAKSSFTTASDGHGGTLVYDPPATTTHAPASGKIDTHWIEMAMADFGGVTGEGYHAGMHDANGASALAPSEHHRGHFGGAAHG